MCNELLACYSRRNDEIHCKTSETQKLKVAVEKEQKKI